MLMAKLKGAGNLPREKPPGLAGLSISLALAPSLALSRLLSAQ